MAEWYLKEMHLQFVFDPTEYYKLYLVMGLLLLL